MKLNVFMVALAAVAVVACSKDEQKVDSYSGNVESFRDMNIPEGFDFAGTKTVTLKSLGNSNLPEGTRDLLKVQTSEGLTVLKHNLDLSKNFEMTLDIPADTKELVVINGLGIERKVKITSQVIDLNSI